MNLKNKATKIFSSKYFLYFVIFVAVINMLGYLALYNFNAILFFGLISLISYQFSKNITLILLISLLMTNLFMVDKPLKEGLENQDKEPVSKNLKDSKNSKESKNSKATPVKKETKPVDVNNIGLNSAITDDGPLSEGDAAPEPFESSGKSNKEKLGGSRIDYASTIESAYDSLEGILGGDGIQSLTKDTKQLMEQQQQLFKTMESMTPMLETAKSMLEGFDLKSLEGLSGLASSFSSSGLAK